MGVVWNPCSYQEPMMPENQLKLIHVFIRKQLVLQTSHNTISIHYKYGKLHGEIADENHDDKPKSS